jgi:hypothetical protein
MSRDSALAVATGNPVPETPNVHSVPSETADAPLQSTPFSLMAKKEAEIVRRNEELKKERALIDSEKLKIKDIQKQYDDYQSTKQKDPIAALKMLGFSETDILNYLAHEETPELSSEEKAIQAAEKAADAKIRAFEEAQAKRVKEEQLKVDQGLIDNYKRDIGKVVQSQPDEFEYCNYYGKEAQDLIYEYARQVVKTSKGQDFVTAEEAAKVIEQHFEEKDQEMNAIKKRTKASSSNDQTRAEASTEGRRTSTVTPGFPGEPQPKPSISRSRTLSGTAATVSAASRVSRNETKDQKRERLMDALRNGTKL